MRSSPGQGGCGRLAAGLTAAGVIAGMVGVSCTTVTPAEDPALASWLPVLPGLTPHGLRHGHQTWMEEAGVSDLLRSERMGHEVPGMRGVYGHVSPAMRADLKAMLQARWQASLRERTRLARRSVVPTLDALLAVQCEPTAKIRSHLAPRNGHSQRQRH